VRDEEERRKDKKRRKMCEELKKEKKEEEQEKCIFDSRTQDFSTLMAKSTTEHVHNDSLYQVIS
jgi:hypothetical protein